MEIKPIAEGTLANPRAYSRTLVPLYKTTFLSILKMTKGGMYLRTRHSKEFGLEVHPGQQCVLLRLRHT